MAMWDSTYTSSSSNADNSDATFDCFAVSPGSFLGKPVGRRKKLSLTNKA